MQAEPSTNLNILSHNAALSIMKKALEDGYIIKKIYVDTVGDPSKYQQFLWANLKDFKCLEEIVVTPKADHLYKVVSAASICAKVIRDKIIMNWSFPEKLSKILII